ncbi:hypothetical protein [Zavarzinia compransoris]|nr:hypothetical protein [Zavarzinia compransoris]
MFRRLLPPILLLFALAGCTTWEKPGATDVDRDRVVAFCEVEGYDRYPQVLESYLAVPAYWEPPVTTCHYDRKRQRDVCSTSGGYWVPEQWETRDLNDAPRRSVFEACMFRQGWHKETR